MYFPQTPWPTPTDKRSNWWQTVQVRRQGGRTHEPLALAVGDRVGVHGRCVVRALAAQEPPLAPIPVAPDTKGVTQAYAYVPVIPHESTPPNAPPPPPPQGGPIRKWWFKTCNCTTDAANKMGYCCFSTHNSIGCGNFPSDMVFIFGTCRQFFGEACMQPPIPAPPGANRFPGPPGPPGPPPGIPFGGPYTGTAGSSPYQ